MKIVFFGTSNFAVPALEALFKAGYEIFAVITTPDELAGRKQILTPPPIKSAAQKLGLELFQPQKLDSAFLELLLAGNYNLETILGVVTSYGKIIPKSVIDRFSFGIINIHPSLLPKYRGPSPIQTQLLDGETETGVTIIKIDEQVDHGPILATRILKIKNQKYEELHDELARLGAELLIKILPDYLAGNIVPVQQNHGKATFTHMITKNDGKIDWNKPAKQVYNQFRALHIWPGIWTLWQKKILKITDCTLLESVAPSKSLLPGSIFFSNRGFFVACRTGCIEIVRLHLDGGKEMDGRSFFAGHKDFVGSTLD